MSENCSGQCQSPLTSKGVKNKHIENDDFGGAFVSSFNVPKMDCPSEERLIRLALEGVNTTMGLQFDIPNRLVKVFHDDHLDEITNKLKYLNLVIGLIISLVVLKGACLILKLKY